MRILFALSYGPGPTRVRSRQILERLCDRHDVTLLGLAWNDSDREALVRWRGRTESVHIIPHPRLTQLRGLVGNPLRPFQQMVATSPEFASRIRVLIQDAVEDGRPYDAVHIEHFRGAAASDLIRGLNAHVVLDAVDCLAELAAQAQRNGSRWTVRAVAAAESWRTRRAEDRLLDVADVVTVVAERDWAAMTRDRMLDNVLVVPNGVERSHLGLGRLPGARRAIFTGKLSYHANEAALRWLLDDIWPLVKDRVPEAELTIAGDEPPGWLRKAAAGREFVLVANPPEMEPLIRNARVAVAPIVYSVGIQNKVLEAMAAGRPVVTTGSAADGFGYETVPGIACADSTEAFAAEVVRLFCNDDYAESLREEGYRYVMSYHDWDLVVRMFEELYGGIATPAKVA